MHSIHEKADRFIKKIGFDCESMDVVTSCRQFAQTMKQGLQSSGGSLQMIPTYLSSGADIRYNEPVIVIDAGGTNIRVAVIRMSRDGSPIIEDYNKYGMPGANEEISSEIFFDRIASYVAPLLKKTRKIGFCFSYAAKPTEDMDGEILQMGKQIKITGITGKRIGRCLNESIEKFGASGDNKIIVLNDSVATLLGGKALSGKRSFDSYIGFVFGTGINTSYEEKTENIKKLSLKPGGSMIINMETCDYSGFKKSIIDERVDAKTIDPGVAVFEKMVSGRYQGNLLFEFITCAISEKLFSDAFSRRFAKSVTVLAPQSIDEFINSPYGENMLAECCSDNEEDRETLYYFIEAIFERAAKLVTINLTSIMEVTDAGKNPCRPVCITAEGSTFDNSKFFNNKLQYYMHLNDGINRYFEIVRVEKATLTGTAIAALVNT